METPVVLSRLKDSPSLLTKTNRSRDRHRKPRGTGDLNFPTRTDAGSNFDCDFDCEARSQPKRYRNQSRRTLSAICCAGFHRPSALLPTEREVWFAPVYFFTRTSDRNKNTALYSKRILKAFIRTIPNDRLLQRLCVLVHQQRHALLAADDRESFM